MYTFPRVAHICILMWEEGKVESFVASGDTALQLSPEFSAQGLTATAIVCCYCCIKLSVRLDLKENAEVPQES